MKPLFLQQGHTYAHQSVQGWYVSEKFDGQRAFWDGGLSRGVAVSRVPYANRSKDKREYAATGLWSRYGKVIHAPPYILDSLPPIALDLEIWGGYGNFQTTTGIVRSLQSFGWMGLELIAFDAPPIHNFLNPRFIDLPQAAFMVEGVQNPVDTIAFRDRLEILDTLNTNRYFRVAQHTLNHGEIGTILMNTVLEHGGEGVVYRSSGDIWIPERVHTVLKRKPTYSGTGKVVGTTAGKGKYEGMTGALIISSAKHGEFQLSGMTDAERKPGHYAVGTTVKYIFDSLTEAGIPRNARIQT